MLSCVCFLYRSPRQGKQHFLNKKATGSVPFLQKKKKKKKKRMGVPVVTREYNPRACRNSRKLGRAKTPCPPPAWCPTSLVSDNPTMGTVGI